MIHDRLKINDFDAFPLWAGLVMGRRVEMPFPRLLLLQALVKAPHHSLLRLG